LTRHATAQQFRCHGKAGVAAIYGPGTNIPEAANEVIAMIRRRRKAA
jgi:methylmalonyl-CoA mutase